MEIKTCIPQRLPLKHLNWTKLIPLIGSAREAIGRYDEALKKAPRSAIEILKWKEASLSLQTYAASDKKLRLQKIRYVKKGLDFGMAWAKKHSLNLSFYCQLHKIVKQDASNPKEIGKLRVKQNWIGTQGCTIEKAYFYPPNPQKLKKYLQELFCYDQYPEKDPLVQTAILFAQFLIIHPFMDGNGRIARICIPLYLSQKGLLSKPYFFMSAYFAKHRIAYFKKLFHISETGGWETWISYFLTGVIEQSNKLKLQLH